MLAGAEHLPLQDAGEPALPARRGSNPAGWPAQVHAGENTGTTPTHVLFVEVKEPSPVATAASLVVGPA